MLPISLDLRTRILAACDAGGRTREVAARFAVSESLVRKLKQVRRESGRVGPAPRRHGPPPKWLPHADAIRAAVKAEPDLTLAEYLARLALPLSVPGLARALRALRLVRKKSRRTRPSAAGPT